ncbi:MAG: hypothetical protein WC054_15290 [Candidatus Nanopelagicales bacterium]
MDMTIKSSKTFAVPIGEVWSAQTDVHALPSTYTLREATGPTLEPVGATMSVFSVLSGTLKATTEQSVPPTCHVAIWRGSKWLNVLAWIMSTTYVSRVELTSTDNDQTRVTASTTIRVRALISAACVLAFVIVMQLLSSMAPSDPAFPPANATEIVAFNLVAFLSLWLALGILTPLLTAKSSSSNSIQRITRGLKQHGESLNR